MSSVNRHSAQLHSVPVLPTNFRDNFDLFGNQIDGEIRADNHQTIMVMCVEQVLHLETLDPIMCEICLWFSNLCIICYWNKSCSMQTLVCPWAAFVTATFCLPHCILLAYICVYCNHVLSSRGVYMLPLAILRVKLTPQHYCSSVPPEICYTNGTVWLAYVDNDIMLIWWHISGTASLLQRSSGCSKRDHVGVIFMERNWRACENIGNTMQRFWEMVSFTIPSALPFPAPSIECADSATWGTNSINNRWIHSRQGVFLCLQTHHCVCHVCESAFVWNFLYQSFVTQFLRTYSADKTKFFLFLVCESLCFRRKRSLYAFMSTGQVLFTRCMKCKVEVFILFVGSRTWSTGVADQGNNFD